MLGSWLNRAWEGALRYPWRDRFRATRGALIVLALAVPVTAWGAMHRPEPPVPLTWTLSVYVVFTVVMAALLRVEDAFDGEAPLRWWHYCLVALAVLGGPKLVELTWGPRPWGLDLDAPVSAFTFVVLVGWLRKRRRPAPAAQAGRDEGGAPRRPSP